MEGLIQSLRWRSYQIKVVTLTPQSHHRYLLKSKSKVD